MAESVNVGKLCAALLQENNGTFKPEAPLKQARFMDNILAGMGAAVSVRIFGSHHQEAKAALSSNFVGER